VRRARAIAAALALLAAPALAQPSGPGFTPLHPVIYELETLQTGPLTPELLKKAGPIHSLPAIEELLKANLVPFAWSRRQVSARTLAPDLTRQMDVLPPHEVFMVREGQGWVFGVVLAKH
jgi:hypothetical protein